jgi:hypothetical protein
MLTFPTLITGTITGLRISAVDGTAFLDNCAALIPYADGNHRIEIYDSSNRMLKGVLKAAGSSEMLGDELITNGTFDNTTGWTPQGGSWSGFSWEISGGVATATNTTKYFYQSSVYGVGKLIKFGADVVVTSGTVRLALDNMNNGFSITTTGIGQTSYRTKTTVNESGLFGITSFTGTVDNFTAKQVLTPSSSGATIVSAKGGDIYNFASKDASFTYNAASYRYAIYDTLKVVM